MGWISPTGGFPDGWFEWPYIFDDDEATFALSPMPHFQEWSTFCNILHADINCNKIRVKLGWQYSQGMIVDLDVRLNGVWKDLYEGIWMNDKEWDKWEEFPFSEGSVGTMRLRIKTIDPITSPRLKWYEADFWEVEAPPPAAGGVTALYLTFARPPT